MKKLYVIAFLAIFLIFILFIWRSSSNVYEYPIGGLQELTEATALEITRKALVDHGQDDSIIHAVPYQDGKDLFAQNTLDKNKGYVLWQVNGNDTLYAFIVYVEKKGTQVIATVKEPK